MCVIRVIYRVVVSKTSRKTRIVTLKVLSIVVKHTRLHVACSHRTKVAGIIIDEKQQSPCLTITTIWRIVPVCMQVRRLRRPIKIIYVFMAVFLKIKPPLTMTIKINPSYFQ